MVKNTLLSNYREESLVDARDLLNLAAGMHVVLKPDTDLIVEEAASHASSSWKS